MPITRMPEVVAGALLTEDLVRNTNNRSDKSTGPPARCIGPD